MEKFNSLAAPPQRPSGCPGVLMLLSQNLTTPAAASASGSIEPADTDGGRVTVTTAAGDVATYDAVVLATHADVSLAMLGDRCPRVCRLSRRTRQNLTPNLLLSYSIARASCQQRLLTLIRG